MGLACNSKPLPSLIAGDIPNSVIAATIRIALNSKVHLVICVFYSIALRIVHRVLQNNTLIRLLALPAICQRSYNHSIRFAEDLTAKDSGGTNAEAQIGKQQP